jgi:hypothetical protein
LGFSFLLEDRGESQQQEKRVAVDSEKGRKGKSVVV